MTQYATQIGHARLAATLQATAQRVTKLETRTSSIDSGFPVAVLPAVIDAGYSGSGNPQAYVNGATSLSGPYQCLTSCFPFAGASVLLAPVGANSTYVIVGVVAAAPAQWIPLTLDSGWSTLAGQTPPQYRLNEDNTVSLVGAVQFTSAITAQNVCSGANVLPAAFRPANQQYIASPPGSAGLQVSANGNLLASSNAATQFCNFNGRINLGI